MQFKIAVWLSLWFVNGSAAKDIITWYKKHKCSRYKIHINFGKCSKILSSFLFLFSARMWVIRAGIHKMLVRIANREDPDQTASSEAV